MGDRWPRRARVPGVFLASGRSVPAGSPGEVADAVHTDITAGTI